MNKPIVTVKEKKYFVSSVSVVLKLNSGPLIHLSLSNKLDGTESKLSNEETFKTEFFQDICQEAEGSFAWGGQTIKFILVGYNSSEARTFELVGLVVKKDVIDWFNENNFKDKKQDYFIYQKSNGGNSWPWLNKVLGEKFEQPNPDFVDKIKFLFPDNACIWRYRDSNNFHFLNRTIAFASRHLPEVQGWCAFDADKPLRLILFEEKKQDNSIPKLDQTWNPSHLFLPNRYSWNRWLDRSCTLSRDISINTGQEIALIKQLVSDGSNGEDAQKGKNFQAQNPTRLLFSPGTINIGDRNIFCHTVSYEFKLPAFEEKESPSVTMKIEMDYPERQIGDNEVVSLRLQGKFQKWEKEKDEETKVKIAPPDINNWGIIDEKNQSLKSGDDAVLYTQILSPTYSDKKYSGIYIKHEKDDEMIVDIHPCGIPLVLGSVQKYRKELEKADVTLSGQKLAISVSEHYQSLDKSEAIILDNSEIKLNHGKRIFGQAQQEVDFLSKNIELGSTQIEINSGRAKINALLNVSFPSPKVPTPNVPSSLVVAELPSKLRGGGNGGETEVSKASSSSSSTSPSMTPEERVIQRKKEKIVEEIKNPAEFIGLYEQLKNSSPENQQEINATIQKREEERKKLAEEQVTASPTEVFKEDPEDFLRNNILFPLGGTMNSVAGSKKISSLSSNNINRFTIKELEPGKYVLEAVGENEIQNKEQYIEAAYIPYVPTKVTADCSNVCHTTIDNNTNFAFTTAMNGCAMAVTLNNNGSFEAWHFQNPDSNQNSTDTFKARTDLLDWYGFDEYHDQDKEDNEHPTYFETSVFLYQKRNEWYILSQLIFLDVNDNYNSKSETNLYKNIRPAKTHIRKLTTVPVTSSNSGVP